MAAGRRVRQNYSADSPAAEHPNKQIGSRSFFLGIRNVHLALEIHYDLDWILGWASVCHSCVLLSYDAKSNFWSWKHLDRSFQLVLISSIYSSVWDKAWNSNNICHHWNVDGANNQIGTFPFGDLTRWRLIQFRAWKDREGDSWHEPHFLFSSRNENLFFTYPRFFLPNSLYLFWNKSTHFWNNFKL